MKEKKVWTKRLNKLFKAKNKQKAKHTEKQNTQLHKKINEMITDYSEYIYIKLICILIFNCYNPSLCKGQKTKRVSEEYWMLLTLRKQKHIYRWQKF